MADGTQRKTPFVIDGWPQLLGGLHVETLAGAFTMNNTHGAVLKLDPGGAHRNVTLADGDGNSGRVCFVVNAADAAENLVVKNSAGDTVATVNQNEAGWFMNAGGSDWALVAIVTIALS